LANIYLIFYMIQLYPEMDARESPENRRCCVGGRPPCNKVRATVYILLDPTSRPV
jgi:hypothetical protein